MSFTDANGETCSPGDEVLWGNRFNPLTEVRVGRLVAVYQDGDADVDFYSGPTSYRETVKFVNLCKRRS